MSKIAVLPDLLKNKIAAGEVVERPASVLKELVENSLDAGSSQIDVEVARGGKGLIRVSDDGDGMDREDALLAFRRHATSKLAAEEDLFNIRTLGFRGEALPSIASVSRTTMSTAPRGAASGVSITMEGGEVRGVKDAAARGTTVEVRDLFFNTPARKKFLKRDSTELLQIMDSLTRLALPHPEVGFRFTSDGELQVELPKAGGLRERISQVYGSEFLDGLLEAEGGDEDAGLIAFFSRPDNLRETRANQMVFINGRAVRDTGLNHAVYSAYEGVLPKDRHPMYFLFITLDPRDVDFNVHPTKREVRFVDKDSVYRLVRGTILEGLRAKREAEASAAMPTDQEAGAAYAARYAEAASAPLGSALSVAEALPFPYRVEAPSIYLGDTFVAVAEGGGLTLIDHHAAHERVLYEKLLKGRGLGGHKLLFPRQVRLSRKEHMALMEQREMLLGMGIEVEDFGQDTVLVRSLPEAMEEADLRGVLSDAAEAVLTGERPGKSLRESVAARVACHGSVRGRVVLTGEAVSALLASLDACDDPWHCPHGRPTRVRYSLDDLKRLFKRK